MVLRKASLYYKDRRSDKEYHIQLNSQGYGYTVTSQFGPRGGTLTHVDLTRGDVVSFAKACGIFEKKEGEKRAKGYSEAKSSTAVLAQRLSSELLLGLSTFQWNRLAEWIERYVEEQI